MAINAGIAFNYAEKWHDSKTLFQTAAARQPHSFWVQMKLGEVMRDNRQFTKPEKANWAAFTIRPLSSSALGGIFWAVFEQDCARHHRVCSDSREVTAFFVAHGSDKAALTRLRQRLSRSAFHPSAAIVTERLHQLNGEESP